MESIRLLLDLYGFTPGRMVFCVQLTKEAAQQRKLSEIVVACDVALEAARGWMGTLAAWERTKNAPRARAGGDAAALDPALDRAVSGIHDVADNHVRSLSQRHPLALAAQEFLRKAYPSGPAGITSKSFEEELAAVQELLGRFGTDGDLATYVKDLSLQPFVQELELRATEFEAALRKAGAAEVAFGKVKEADALAQERLAQLVVKIAGMFNTQEPEHVQARRDLLGPIMEQNQRIGEARKRRRPIGDVDPTTGSTLPVSPSGPESPGV
jgi:hypothetical protein